jgi:hypothetical protein
MIQPTRQVTISGVDVSDDVLDIQAVDVCLDHGLPHVQITLSNIASKYATLWPPFVESGLYYPGVVKFNNVEIMQFRFEGLNPELSKKNTIVVDGLVVGATPLQKQYMTKTWIKRQADTLIQDVTVYATATHDYGSGITSVSYTSPSQGELVNYAAKREYCHDIIRKILEKEQWTGTIRATSASAALLNIFPVNDASHQHATIFQYGDLAKQGKSPRDVKESANVLEITGGKSLQEPSDGDNWTEPTIFGGKSEAWHLLTGYGILGTTATPHACGSYALVGKTASITSPTGNPMVFELHFQEALGAYYDAIARNLSAISFESAIDTSVSQGNRYTIRIALEDSHGAIILSNEIHDGPLTRNQFSDMIFKAVPEAPGDGWTLEKDVGLTPTFDWTQLSKLRLIFNWLIAPVSMPLTYFVDCFSMTQNFIPQVRVVDSTRQALYDTRMQNIDAPEYTELNDLRDYGLKLVQASATPTYYVDHLFEFDPSTELIKAGWQVRFNMSNFGIASGVWWRVLEAGWIWNKQDGLLLHLVAIPASSGSYDYSKNISSRVWTKDRAGLDKNIIDAIRALRNESEQFSGVTVFTGNVGFNATCDPCTLNGNALTTYNWNVKISLSAIGAFTGQVNLSQTNNVNGTVNLQDSSLNLTGESPDASTILTISTFNTIVAGTYKVTVTAISADGTIDQSVDVAVIIGKGEVIITCGGDSDCKGGQICVGGQCYSTCTSDAQCSDGSKCTPAPGRSDGKKVCVSNNIIMSCGDVQVPGDGTQIMAPVANITMPDTSWKIIFDYYDHDNYVLNGDASFNLVYNGDGTATIFGTFKNKGWACGKKLKIGLIVAGGQVGTTNFPPALTCWFNIVINCNGMFILEVACSGYGGCDSGCSGCGWGASFTHLSGPGSMGGGCGGPCGFDDACGGLRVRSIQGYTGNVTVTLSGCTNGGIGSCAPSGGWVVTLAVNQIVYLMPCIEGTGATEFLSTHCAGGFNTGVPSSLVAQCCSATCSATGTDGTLGGSASFTTSYTSRKC